MAFYRWYLERFLVGLELTIIETMTDQEQIKLLLFGDIQKYIVKKKLGEEDKLCLLLYSSKDYEAFVKKDVFTELKPSIIQILPREPLFEDLKKLLKENSETLERE